MARDLRLFYLFRLLSTSYLYVPIAMPFAMSRHLTLVEFMLLNTVYCAVVILTEVPTGAIADRLGRRATMSSGALVMIAASLIYYAAHSFAMFAVAEGLAALSMTLCSGADSAYLFDLLNDHGQSHEYARREGTASAWHQAGQALAFLAGGLLAMKSLALPYLVTAGVATVAFFVALGMREERPSSRPVSAKVYLDDMRASLRAVAHRRQLIWAIGYSVVVFGLLRATIYIYQPYLREQAYNYAETGIVFAAMYLIAAAVSHNFGQLRQWLAEPALLWGLLGTLIVTFLILGGTHGPGALVAMGIQNAANGLYSPLTKILLQREIESHRRATVLSVESMIRRAGFGLLSPALGAVMTAYNPRAGLTFCGIVGLGGFVVLALTYRGGAQAAQVDVAAQAVQTRPD